jgi:hypothetical protein
VDKESIDSIDAWWNRKELEEWNTSARVSYIVEFIL